MDWETPQFTEIKMDAEINGYQDDAGGPLNPPWMGAGSTSTQVEEARSSSTAK